VLLQSFNTVERCISGVQRSFRGLSEGIRALEVFHSHAAEAWSASELLQDLFYEPF